LRNRVLIITVIICLALLVSALPVLTSCGGGSKEGKTLKIGITTPTTGKAAEKGRPMGDANLDAIKYINDELGGVEGYKIDVVWRDNGYDAANVVNIVNNFMDEGCLMFATSSSAMMTASMETANRAGFAGLAAFSSPVIYRPPQHIYGQLPDYGDDFLAFAKYYLDNVWKGKTGKPKFAIHALNNSTGKGAIDAARAYADSMGIEILWDGQVGKAFEHKADSTSEMESLTRIKAMNPDVLYISSTPAPTALIVKNAVQLGMFPGITIASGHAGFTKALLDIAGSDAEGVYGVFPTVSWGENVPGMAKVMEYAQKNHPDDVGNGDYITSWAQSLIMAEILKVAVKNAGYDALAKGDAAAWTALETKGIQKLKDYDVGGLHGPVTYTPGDNRLAKSVRVFQVKSGDITAITGWIDAPVVKYEDFDWFGK
jgi:branched-chain amino acid transport system substrate-binding protein